MLRFLITQTQNIIVKGSGGSSGRQWVCWDLNGDNDFTGTYLSPSSRNFIYEMCTAFTCQSYLNKEVERV